MTTYRLNVPYREKDAAKALGAKWNYVEKFWYCNELTDALRRWYQPDEEEGVSGETDQSTVAPAASGIADAVAPQAADGDPYARYQSVTAVNLMIAGQFERTDRFQTVLVKGEVTNYRGPNGGHHYFSIKDEHCLLSCVIWSYDAAAILRFPLESGKQVALAGRLAFFDKRGTVSLHVRQIADMGAGDASLRYLQLKARLEEEGLFAIEHKKPIPKFPEKVGIITSKNGQARKDIEKIALKRNPYVQLVLYHVNVQGENACRTILEGIERMDAMGLDTLIVGRGGGSDEELIAYNDEAIARAVYAAKTPVISAVGHEGNWALIDFVSDLRAATPSEAAEEAIPDIMTTIRQIRQLEKNIRDNMHNALEKRKLRLRTQEARLKGNDPVRKLKERKEKLKHLEEGLTQKIRAVYERKNHRFRVLLERLNGLSPTAKLVKGFGYISVSGQPVTGISDVQPEDILDITIHDGHIVTKVTETVAVNL
ncbi:MAG: exodeoxyribonuclease VII large subunit [Lachnospiraceae bacterium]|nr:exodeoxyribonuclease VII large subunit [Lachnospiraceae bacterium]